MPNPERFTGEGEPGREEEAVESRVVLEFARHGAKESDPDKPNEDLELTPKGRKQARERGVEIDPQPEVSVAYGSPRKRTQDTAARMMLAKESQITDEMSLEEIEQVIEQEAEHERGPKLKKVAIDERLNFIALEDNEYRAATSEAYKEDRLFEFIVNESDELAKKLGDKSTYTYSRNAGQVAEIIKKYLKVGEAFHRVVARDPDKYERLGNQMERYMGTHQSISESFIAKYLEIAEGTEARDEFVKAVGQAGFDELQGFRVEVVNRGEEQHARLYAKVNDKEFEFDLNPEILDKLIQDVKE